MTTSIEFIEYVYEQIEEFGSIRYKKMFGDYAIYCNEKVIGLVCNDQFFLKKTGGGEKLLGDFTEAPPYKGAKPYFLIDFLDDKELLKKIVDVTYEETPAPKPKKPKNNLKK